MAYIDETDSTNRWLRDLPSKEQSSPIMVWADYQTAGRGCGTNTWESERGRNLLFSALLYPKNVPAASQFLLSMANALALRDTLADYTDDVKIKWPNDIYWRDKKICGTLIETTLQGSNIRTCIIGTGLNVNQSRFVSPAPNPVSLCQIIGHEVSREEVGQKVVSNMSKYMTMVERGAWEAIRAAYRRHLYRLDETHDYRFTDGTTKPCRLTGVTDDGHLELLSSGGDVYRLAFKEVQFII